MIDHLEFKAVTPGSSFPSKSSKLAPPPVEQWLTFSSVPNLAAAVAVSPPPMTVVAPRFVASTTASINCLVPLLNESNSNTPTGPFHNIVLLLAITFLNSLIDSSPISNPIQPSGIPFLSSTWSTFAFLSNLSPIT